MNADSNFQRHVGAIVSELGDWLEACDYAGNDPYQLDHLITSASQWLVIGPAVSALRQFLKPYHAFIPKRLFASSPAIVMAQVLGNVLSAEACCPRGEISARRAKRLFELIDRHRSPLVQSYGWGLPFSWGGADHYPPHWPTTITTAIVLNGLLDGIDLLDREKVLRLVSSGIKFMLEECGFEETQAGPCLRFGPGDTRLILNASAAGAVVLMRVGQLLGRSDYIDLASHAAELIIAHQNADGSWYYAPAHKEHRVDSIIDSRHTGYILESLSRLNAIFCDPTIERALDAGWVYNKSKLMDDDKPRWSPAHTWPVDSHDVAQAIQTAIALGKTDIAETFLRCAVNAFYKGNGLFRYKLFEDGRSNDAVFIRWTQAPMYKAMSLYLSQSRAA
jgi:hypothetical protein